MSLQLPFSLTLTDIVWFLILSAPASIISTYLANRLLDQDAGLGESVVEFIVRSIIFYVLFFVMFLVATVILESGLFAF